MKRTEKSYWQYRVISKFFQPIPWKPEFDQTLYWVFEVCFRDGEISWISPSPRLGWYESREELENEFKFIYDRLKDEGNTTLLEEEMPERYQKLQFKSFSVEIGDKEYEDIAERLAHKTWNPSLKEDIKKDIQHWIERCYKTTLE